MLYLQFFHNFIFVICYILFLCVYIYIYIYIYILCLYFMYCLRLHLHSLYVFIGILECMFRHPEKNTWILRCFSLVKPLVFRFQAVKKSQIWVPKAINNRMQNHYWVLIAFWWLLSRVCCNFGLLFDHFDHISNHNEKCVACG